MARSVRCVRDEFPQKQAGRAHLASGGAKLDSKNIEWLSARDYGTDIAMLPDVFKCVESVGECDDLMSAFFNKSRHRSLDSAARIDHDNTHHHSTD
jgi:hypothetical protein